MDISKYIMDLINNGLFPIACCGGLLYALIMVFKAYRDDIKKLNTQHETEIKDFTKALNQIYIALNKLCDRLDKGVDNEK